jgi:hypothetical protein
MNHKTVIKTPFEETPGLSHKALPREGETG